MKGPWGMNKIAKMGNAKEPRWHGKVSHPPHAQSSATREDGSALGREAQGGSQGQVGSDRPDACEEAEIPEARQGADLIPAGWYCYTSITPPDNRGRMRIKRMCPFWETRPGERAYCRFLNYETEHERELLWDQVKICGVNDKFDEEVFSASHSIGGRGNAAES